MRILMSLVTAVAGLTAGALGGTDVRKDAAAYPVHVLGDRGSVGAEFAGRAITGPQGSHMTGDYLAIEVGVFLKEAGVVRASDFMLRINGAKQLVYPQVPGMVSASLRHPEWERERGLVVGGGMGDAGIVIGGQRRPRRFPDDRERPEILRPETGTGGQLKDDIELAAEAVVKLALDEGDGPAQRAGYLYFGWGKKVKDIKKLELVWVDGEHKRTLRLK